MRRHRIAALVVSVVVVALAVASAQSSLGHIRGVVTDTSGAVLPGVTVSLSGVNVIERKTTTDEKGAFSFLAIEAGRYTVTAVLAGFNRGVASADVTAGNTLKLALSLGVSSLTETLAVTGASPSANTRAASKMRASASPQMPAGVAGRVMGDVSGFNTEAYDRITDNAWTEVARKPLSTFSSDVDTASYANVRRFLNQGQAPPKDAVRVEELVNYFTFNYPEPRDGRPHHPHCRCARSVPCRRPGCGPDQRTDRDHPDPREYDHPGSCARRRRGGEHAACRGSPQYQLYYPPRERRRPL